MSAAMFCGILVGRRVVRKEPAGAPLVPGILRDTLELGLIALVVAVVEALAWPIALALVIGIWPPLADLPAIAAAGWPVLVVTAPVMAVWLLGAVQTRRAIRRLGGLNAGDRAAVAELYTLLARE